jgi:hypothetical protein
MKKLTLLALLASISLSTFADDKEKKEMPLKKNCVKLNLSSLGFKIIGLQYERAIAPKFSAALQIRFSPSSSLPGVSNFKDQIDGNQAILSTKMSSIAITPEFRYYVRHAMKGFYLAPYLRYRNINMDIPFSYVNSNNATQVIDLNGKFSSFGGGLMMGSHFNIGKSISLDWFIIGFQYMSTKADISATHNLGFSAAEQQKLRDELNSGLGDIDQLLKDNTVTVDANKIGVTSKVGLPGLRGMGINIGYRF